MAAAISRNLVLWVGNTGRRHLILKNEGTADAILIGEILDRPEEKIWVV
jgi:hypothetical protein